MRRVEKALLFVYKYIMCYEMNGPDLAARLFHIPCCSCEGPIIVLGSLWEVSIV